MATRQAGVVGRKQLAALGFARNAVDLRVEQRKLIPSMPPSVEVTLTDRVPRNRYTVVRFTWRQVLHETLLVTVRIGQLLARGA